MPILDPSLQLYLICNFNDEECLNNDFFLRYLQIAASNFEKNLNTIQASLQFKEDLIASSSVINKIFEENLSFQNELNNPSISNYYSYLLEKIKQKHIANLSKINEGYYYNYKDIYQMHLFQPSNNFSKLRAWYFTDSPIAILCVNLNKFKNNEIIPYINLEIDLMAASGFSLVLCLMSKINLDILHTFIKKTISTHQFTEIHFNYNVTDANKNSKYEFPNYIKVNSSDLYNFLVKYEDIFTNNGYFYFYTRFPEGDQQKNAFKKYKSQTPFFKLIFFSSDMLDAFKHGSMESGFLANNDFFVHCKTGFGQDMIRVILCNVPLYNSLDDENDFIPVCSSGFAFGYVKKKDFLYSENFRVHILFDDIINNCDYSDKYVDFDDLHLIRPDFYVKDALNLTRTDSKTLTKIKKIQINADKKFIKDQGEEIKKENIFHLLNSKQINKCLEYVIYAYQHFANYAKSFENFHVHTNQIFAAFEACKVCLLNDNENEKGVVYQVETGEGKSCIIQLIAAVLALYKKTVHITSSNINLANRDYYDSYSFFKELNLESAVLLHYNELPYINFQNLPNDDTEYKKEFYPRKYFMKKLFDNPSNMNFSVCGLNNQNELNKDKANIVFSTFINFESLYLRLMELYPSNVHKYFNKCALLIDEADSILIDELTNGTILSRPMNTNGKEILAFVYKCYQEKYDVKQVLNEVKSIWPECTDISENDISEMFNEIEIVNQNEFTNGKKYSIEKMSVNEKKNSKRKVEEIISSFRTINVEEIKNVLKLIKKDDFTDETNIDLSNENQYIINDNYENSDSESIDLEIDISIEEINEDNKSQSNKKTKKRSLTVVERGNKKDIKSNLTDKSRRKSLKRLKNDHSKIIDDIKNDDDENTSNNDNKNKKSHDKSRRKSFKKSKDIITKEYKIIIPFDYEHKGVLEPNKEFSGFIQQFIAIKEIFNDEKNKNMLIKDISMNYLYVSHPIFVNLYGGVCGFTGTIGTKHDKKAYQDHYKLSTKKIPRNAPNRLINLPIILCSNIKERNTKIVEEVNEFHNKENPILVIFKDLNEIFDVYHALRLKGIKNINIFDGKDEKIKPDNVSGSVGAVSLGTNVCGRGTDIKEPYKSLHVIVTYYTSNTRVINQAFGRTARQGNDGTVRIICLVNQYFSPQETLDETAMEDVLDDFLLKNNMQIKFIENIRQKRKWIFDSHMKSQKINKEYIQKMRSARINVNRIKACNYKFPICMKIGTYLNIQAQKIFSLYNCPNCKYTWMLFQKYLREMILETWSLFISQSDQEYYSKSQSLPYKKFLENKLVGVNDFLNILIPHSNTKNSNDYEIIPTFIHIFDYVKELYENKILNSFPERISNCFSSTSNEGFCSLFVGFKPYSLIDKSGSRINSLDNENQNHEYITDPELKYLKKQPKNINRLKYIVLSITEKIDDIFNKICMKINEVIGSYMGLKFFLRRTLGGCEFGLCFDFELENLNEKIINDHNCLIDKDPLLVFTINVKSMVPILAGILIIGLIYIAKIAIKIAKISTGTDIQLAGTIVKKTVSFVIEKLLPKFNQFEAFCNKIIEFLMKVVIDQIGFLRTFNYDLAFVFGLLLKIATVNDFSKSDLEINKMFNDFSFIKMSSNFKQKNIPMKFICKIGLLIMLAFGSFMMNFQYKKSALKYNTKKVADEYNKKQKTEEAIEENDKFVEESFD